VNNEVISKATTIPEISSITTLEEALVVIKYLLQENAALRLEVKQLREELSRYKKDSSTSSKPPSTDIVKKPRWKRSGKAGGQLGHPGVKHTMLTESEVDFVEEVKIECCPDCGGAVSAVEAIKEEQVYEFVPKPVIVTQYNRGGGYCAKCGEVKYASLPKGVIEGQQLGIKLQSLLSYLKGGFGASYSEIASFSKDVLNVKVSTGTICNVVMRMSEALKPAHDELRSSLQSAETLNIDETGWKERGNRLWVWVFCNSLISYFTIQTSRGCKVLKEVLGDTFKGSITSDFYSAYVSYACPKQQYCLAHLIRDIKYLKTLPDAEANKFGCRVLTYFKAIFRLWHLRDTVDRQKFLKSTNRIRRKLNTYLLDAVPTDRHANNMKKRLQKHWLSLFRFIADPKDFQPTNNLAERTVRRFTRIRMLTQGSRCLEGRLWNSRMMTVFETCKAQRLSAWTFMQDSLSALYCQAKAPSLVPVVH
jgi:transposase